MFFKISDMNIDYVDSIFTYYRILKKKHIFVLIYIMKTDISYINLCKFILLFFQLSLFLWWRNLDLVLKNLLSEYYMTFNFSE